WTFILSCVFLVCSEKSTVPGQTSTMNFDLTILTKPAGEQIFLDDKDTGFITPHTFDNLLVKTYFLKLVLYNYNVWWDSIFIQTNQKDTTVYVELTPECPGGIIGDINQPPAIAITFASNQPGNRIVQGLAENIDAQQIKVVLWAKTDQWYVQPLVSEPYTIICGDGTWENWTHSWTRMVALLVDSTYNPGATRLYHPQMTRV
ncbi:MAG: PEGA domain-containing protein, partial [Calditrichia bacterium]